MRHLPVISLVCLTLLLLLISFGGTKAIKIRCYDCPDGCDHPEGYLIECPDPKKKKKQLVNHIKESQNRPICYKRYKIDLKKPLGKIIYRSCVTEDEILSDKTGKRINVGYLNATGPGAPINLPKIKNCHDVIGSKVTGVDCFYCDPTVSGNGCNGEDGGNGNNLLTASKLILIVVILLHHQLN